MLDSLKSEALAIIKKIEATKKDDEMISYRVSPLLKELVATLDNVKEESQDAYQFLFDAYNYVGDVYTVIGRFSLAAIYHYKALEYAKKLEKTPSNVKDVLYRLLRDRNYYIDDDCEDVYELVKGLLPIETIDSLFNERKKSRRSLKHDPVEMSEEYLNVIDEVEEKVDQNRTIYGLGACHEIWHLKFQYLLEKGIVWSSPSMLNPRVRFD